MRNLAPRDEATDIPQRDDSYRPGSTDVAVADGGTGASTASGARVNLGMPAAARWARPTGAIAETCNRNGHTADQAVLTSGQLLLMGIWLEVGDVVSTITFISGATALSAGNNQWFALYDASRNLIGVTNDHTSTGWSANASKTLTMATPYTVTTAGFYYLGIMVKATTVPSLRGPTVQASLAGLAPVLVGTSTGSLTNPASAPSTAAALTGVAGLPYAFVS